MIIQGETDHPALAGGQAEGAPGGEGGQKVHLAGADAGGLSRDLNPGPLAPEARIIPLDQQAPPAIKMC